MDANSRDEPCNCGGRPGSGSAISREAVAGSAASVDHVTRGQPVGRAPVWTGGKLAPTYADLEGVIAERTPFSSSPELTTEVAKIVLGKLMKFRKKSLGDQVIFFETESALAKFLVFFRRHNNSRHRIYPKRVKEALCNLRKLYTALRPIDLSGIGPDAPLKTRICFALEKRAMTNVVLAKKIGLTHRVVKLWAAGTSVPPAADASWMAAILDFPSDFFTASPEIEFATNLLMEVARTDRCQKKTEATRAINWHRAYRDEHPYPWEKCSNRLRQQLLCYRDHRSRAYRRGKGASTCPRRPKGWPWKKPWFPLRNKGQLDFYEKELRAFFSFCVHEKGASGCDILLLLDQTYLEAHVANDQKYAAGKRITTNMIQFVRHGLLMELEPDRGFFWLHPEYAPAGWSAQTWRQYLEKTATPMIRGVLDGFENGMTRSSLSRVHFSEPVGGIVKEQLEHSAGGYLLCELQLSARLAARCSAPHTTDQLEALRDYALFACALLLNLKENELAALRWGQHVLPGDDVGKYRVNLLWHDGGAKGTPWAECPMLVNPPLDPLFEGGPGVSEALHLYLLHAYSELKSGRPETNFLFLPIKLNSKVGTRGQVESDEYAGIEARCRKVTVRYFCGLVPPAGFGIHGFAEMARGPLQVAGQPDCARWLEHPLANIKAMPKIEMKPASGDFKRALDRHFSLTLGRLSIDDLRPTPLVAGLPNRLADHLAHYLKRQGATPRQLADCLDCPLPAVENFLAGREKPAREVLARAEVYFALAPGTLVTPVLVGLDAYGSFEDIRYDMFRNTDYGLSLAETKESNKKHQVRASTPRAEWSPAAQAYFAELRTRSEVGQPVNGQPARRRAWRAPHPDRRDETTAKRVETSFGRWLALLAQLKAEPARGGSGVAGAPAPDNELHQLAVFSNLRRLVTHLKKRAKGAIINGSVDLLLEEVTMMYGPSGCFCYKLEIGRSPEIWPLLPRRARTGKGPAGRQRDRRLDLNRPADYQLAWDLYLEGFWREIDGLYGELQEWREEQPRQTSKSCVPVYASPLADDPTLIYAPVLRVLLAARIAAETGREKELAARDLLVFTLVALTAFRTSIYGDLCLGEQGDLDLPVDERPALFHVRRGLIKTGASSKLLKEDLRFILPGPLPTVPGGFNPNEILRDYLRLRARALQDRGRFAGDSTWRKRLLLPLSERAGAVIGTGLAGVTLRERLRCYTHAIAPELAPVGLNIQNFRQLAAGTLFLSGWQADPDLQEAYKKHACFLLLDAPITLQKHYVCWFYGAQHKRFLAILRAQLYGEPVSAKNNTTICLKARGLGYRGPVLRLSGAEWATLLAEGAHAARAKSPP